MSDYYIIEPCASANGVEIRLRGKKLDLKKCESAISPIGEAAGSGGVVLLAKVRGYSVSFYASGRIMLKAGRRVRLKEAEELAREIMDALERGGAIV